MLAEQKEARSKSAKMRIEEQKRRGPSEEGWLATFDKLFDFVENAMRLNGAVRKEAKRNEKKKQNCSGARVRTLSSKLLTSSRQINPLVNSKLLKPLSLSLSLTPTPTPFQHKRRAAC